ncbi:hypothetical protein D3C71_2205090 [compost metagenome]
MATKEAPMWLLAPALFSTMMVCLNISPRSLASERARISEVPPGGLGTMMRIGLLG